MFFLYIYIYIYLHMSFTVSHDKPRLVMTSRQDKPGPSLSPTPLRNSICHMGRLCVGTSELPHSAVRCHILPSVTFGRGCSVPRGKFHRKPLKGEQEIYRKIQNFIQKYIFPDNFRIFHYMAVGKVQICAKYSHRVWEQFPHQANSILRNLNFSMFIKKYFFYKYGVSSVAFFGNFFQK